MTDTQEGNVHSRGTGDGEATTTQYSGSYVFSTGGQHAPHRADVKDLRPLRGHSAVGLRPILDASPRCGAP